MDFNELEMDKTTRLELFKDQKTVGSFLKPPKKDRGPDLDRGEEEKVHLINMGVFSDEIIKG